ncbi:hypothetical protein LY90DRAFT_643560 [Neocallimastix californiae]|uniref:Methyltransferase domain-containing protein n=1 Tax=Neocallimastix californiae TaxID=1754190 RepID=A0A1Y1YDV0_9FUNG|nr:hypothetical protein LY90DRAFT_643560 [Neocallimastix californiae]|eukprot:ORX96177.1 hypothetical protein LY90DRAFT_643560 [Neocallimastix californiae]
MNSFIPSNNYSSLEKQKSLFDILEYIYEQINIIKSNSFFNDKICSFELEFRLRRKYVNIDLKDFLNDNSCQYSEFSYNENSKTRYRIICNSTYPCTENENENETTITPTPQNEFQFMDISKFLNYLEINKDQEITETLNNHMEYTKKITMMTFYYFIFKINLSIEVLLDSSQIKRYLKIEDKSIIESKSIIKSGNNKNIKIEILNQSNYKYENITNNNDINNKDSIFNKDSVFNNDSIINKDSIINNDSNLKTESKYIEKNKSEKEITEYAIYKEMNDIDANFSLSILKYIKPITKKRRSFMMKNGARIDMTVFDDKNQLEIEFMNNTYLEKDNIMNMIHSIMVSLDCSNFILDYLFFLMPNYEFQKPITPSLDILYKEAKNLINDTFYVAAKTDGFRRLIIIINNLMFSISENFHVEYICQTKADFHMVLDCEYLDGKFIPFDLIYYNDEDLRHKSYSDRINIMNAINFEEFNNKIIKKNITKCSSFSELQNFIISFNKFDNPSIPNDGIIITNGQSSYYDNIKVYKIKTRNTVDLRFNGRYFYSRDHLIKKSTVNLPFSEYKEVCLRYHQHKKFYSTKNIKDVPNNKNNNRNNNKNNNNKSNTEIIDNKFYCYYYRKQVEMINDVPTKTRVVTYHLVREKKVPFIVEINLDNNSFVKERKDKYTSNSINTFNSILIASYQKVNLEIFTPSSTVLMRKYHNIIKQNILHKYKGNLLDIGTGNGGDLHKWKNFRKIVCVEPDHEKIKVLKERISKSEIRNRISILQNTIQNVELKDIYDVATCFFALNDFTYTNISRMLSNISKNINGIFCLIFFDYNLFSDDIDSSSITYKQCIQTEINQFKDIIDRTSYIYLLSSLRYAHSECDNIMYINITDSYVINHYEYAINSIRVKEIFVKYGFKLLNEYNIDLFPFLDKSQISYTSNIKVIEFSNINEF